MDVALVLKALGALFAVMNPFAALPLFLSLTSGLDAAAQRRTAVRVVLYCAAMALVIMVGGQAVLGFFGIGINDFRVAGGLVLLTIALGLLHGSSAVSSGNRTEREHQAAQAEVGDVSFYPLTFPMLMGPGTITTLIVLTGAAPGVGGYLAVGVAVSVILLALFTVLWFAGAIGAHMSGTLRTIVTRLMGMILASIAVEMMVTGLIALIPALNR